MRRLIFILGIFLFLQPFFIMTQVQAQDAAPAESQTKPNQETQQGSDIKPVQAEGQVTERGFFHKLFNCGYSSWLTFVAISIVIGLVIIPAVLGLILIIVFWEFFQGVAVFVIIIGVTSAIGYTLFEVFHLVFEFSEGLSWGFAALVFVGLILMLIWGYGRVNKYVLGMD